MSYKFYQILFLLITQFQIYFAAFEQEYPGTIICQNDNVQIESLHSSDEKIKIMNIMKSKNCTHVQGSIYIQGLVNLPDHLKDLSFDTIEEIDGHLIIEGNDLEKITFKNLRMIRGTNTIKRNLVGLGETEFSFIVAGNKNLIELDLRNLRSINAHHVLFDMNPKLQYLPHTIRWVELFTDPKIQKNYSPVSSTDLLIRDKCSDECRKWTNFNQSYCWGPLGNQCQKQTLCNVKYHTECTMCHFLNGEELGCCSDQCVGGCSGGGATKCISCKNMLNENKCVDMCPGPYSGGIAGSTTNKDFKYHAGFFCSKSCPSIMLPEESTCVHRCSEGYFKNKSNHCIKCYGDMCTKNDLPCDLMKVPNHVKNNNYLTSEVLKMLKNCTKIRGYMIITKDTFLKHGITVPMLYENLNKLQDLEGGFSYFLDDNLTNLTFFINLKSFRGAYLHVDTDNMAHVNRFSVSETSLEFLGLKSLKEINGDFLFRLNDKLCYMNFPSSELIKKPNRYWYKAIVKNCEGKICDKECSDKGCWGPGNNMCYACRNFDADGICVSNCIMRKGFYFHTGSSSKNGTCVKCHNECLNTCNGPHPAQCVGECRNKKENATCVTKCSNNYFTSSTDKKLCLPCHSDCADHDGLKCTGPSSVPGQGGCNKCKLVLLDRQSKIVHCVKTCDNGTYLSNNLSPQITQFNPDGIVCVPCTRPCLKCKGKSIKFDDCEICEGVWYKGDCRMNCPKDDFYGIETKNSNKTCKICHSSCKGCRNDKNTDCIRCRKKKNYFNNSAYRCVNACPKEKEIEEIEKSTGDTVCLAVWESRSKIEANRRTHITVGVVVAMLVLLIVVITVIVVYLKRKAIAERLEAELKARYSNLTEPNSKDEDLLSKPPNMGRLMIVSKEDLIFEDESKPLGFGAFGYVYKGKWKITRNEESLLKKASADFHLPVAIKVIKNMGNEEIESVMQEAKMMASVSHMHCLRFIGVCLSYDKPCLISAYVKEGSLDKYLVRNKNKITSLIMLSWSEQIADGMLYLTKRNIIHRDLAARNVLVSRLECVQITDFGLAKMLESTKDKEIIIKTGKVPIRWLAIETLTEGKYSHETDVWAYGVTLWEIFTFGKVPYEDQATHDIFDFVLKGGRLSQPEICSLDVYIVMVNCWLESPNLRPDFQSLMKTFTEYCRNPGRYLSIRGDPYEIPSPNNIEMTNLNNPYYSDRFNFFPTTTETVLPLINARESVDRELKDFTDNDELNESLLSSSDKEPLPTRSMNRTSNIFKLFQDSRQSQNTPNTRNNNAPRLVSLASQEEPTFRNQPSIADDDPRYVADPTEKTIKMRPLPLKTPFLQETPRFHSNTSRENHSPFNNISSSQSPHVSQVSDDYLEPINSNPHTSSNFENTDAEGYLEPINHSNKTSLLSQDEYVVPSSANTPRESLISKPNKNSNAFKQPKHYISMDDGNPHFSNSIDDDGYLEPEPQSRLINSSNR